MRCNINVASLTFMFVIILLLWFCWDFASAMIAMNYPKTPISIKFDLYNKYCPVVCQENGHEYTNITSLNNINNQDCRCLKQQCKEDVCWILEEKLIHFEIKS